MLVVLSARGTSTMSSQGDPTKSCATFKHILGNSGLPIVIWFKSNTKTCACALACCRVCASAQSCASLRVGKNMTWSDLALEATGTTGNYLCPIPQCSFHKNAKTCINIPTSSNTGQTYRRRLRVVMFGDDVSILVHTVSVS